MILLPLSLLKAYRGLFQLVLPLVAATSYLIAAFTNLKQILTRLTPLKLISIFLSLLLCCFPFLMYAYLFITLSIGFTVGQ